MWSSLAMLKSAGFKIFALTNGGAKTVELLLNNANITLSTSFETT